MRITGLKKYWRLWALLILVFTGAWLEYFQLIDWQSMLNWVRDYDQQFWLPALFILIQIILYMFALPGSSLLWLVAPIYEPLLATFILVVGSTLGGLAAYWFAHHTTSALVERVRHQRLFFILQKRSDFALLFSLRLFPGFPHSVINYSAGVLKLPLGSFILSAVLGLSVKTYLYANVIYQTVGINDYSRIFQFETLGILILLVLLTIFVRLIVLRAH